MKDDAVGSLVEDRLVKALAAQVGEGEVAFTAETLEHLHGFSRDESTRFLSRVGLASRDDPRVETLLRLLSDEVPAVPEFEDPSPEPTGEWVATLICILAEQVSAAEPADLVPAAAAALDDLSRAEARLFFGEAGHLVHYGGDKPILHLIQRVARAQRHQAGLRCGDKVELISELLPDPPDFEVSWHYYVVHVGNDDTVDVQPELVMEYLIETAPASALVPATSEA